MINNLQNNILTAISSLEEWLFFIENHNSIDEKLNNNQNIKEIAEKLNLLSPAKKIILVTGTNGKGSSCHLLSNILIEHGYKVGLFTSPHLINYQERMLIQNQQLSKQEHAASLFKVKTHFPFLSGYFKFNFLSALFLCKEQELDFIIVEVGIGGKHDITNILEPDISVITNVDLDHTHILGDSVEEIGDEKARIFRKNKPAIYADSEIPNSVISYAKQINSELYIKDQNYNYNVTKDQKWQWQSDNLIITELNLPKIPIQNAACVLMILKLLKIELNFNIIKEVLNEFQLQGRFQLLNKQNLINLSNVNNYNLNKLPQIILDVGHNNNAAKFLLSQLQELKKSSPNSKIFAICGILNDKNDVAIFDILKDIITFWLFIDLDGNRARSSQILAQDYQACTSKTNYNSCSTINQALDKSFKQENHNDYVLIFGSFHTVEKFIKIL